MEDMSSPLNSEFTQSLHDYMADQEISQAELARRLGISRSYMHQLLGGEGSVTMDTASKLLARIGGRAKLTISFAARVREKIAG